MKTKNPTEETCGGKVEMSIAGENEDFYPKRLGMDFLEKYFNILEKDLNHMLAVYFLMLMFYRNIKRSLV